MFLFDLIDRGSGIWIPPKTKLFDKSLLFFRGRKRKKNTPFFPCNNVDDILI